MARKCNSLFEYVLHYITGTYSYTDFPQDFFWNSPSLFQYLVQRTSILQQEIIQVHSRFVFLLHQFMTSLSLLFSVSQSLKLSTKLFANLRLAHRISCKCHSNAMFKKKKKIRTIYDQTTHHVLHTDTDLTVAVKSTIKAHNIWRVAFMQDLQFSNDLVPDCWFDLEMNELRGRRKKK